MRLKKILINKNSLWIILGLLAVLLSAVLPAAFVEQYYSRGLFVAVRWMFAGLSGWLPFAFVYPLFFLLLGWLIYSISRFVKAGTPLRQRLLDGVLSLLAFAGAVVFLFQMLWGFNYYRIPLEETMGISPEPLSLSELRKELDAATTEVTALRQRLIASDSVVPASLVPPGIESILRRNLEHTLQAYRYPVPGQVRGRLLYPKGILLRISTAGVYIPFTGEGHIDPGLHHLQLPFVMTHEMSHGYGFGDEGTCNFLAFLACVQSDNLFLKYVGMLYYWRYVASDYRDVQPDQYREIYETLPQGMKNDLKAIREEMDKYPDLFPAVRDAAYNAYLQAQGIEEGIKNYDRVIMMVYAWRKQLAIQK